MEPTKRFVIEPLLQCNLKCKFCYHLHKFDRWKDFTKPVERVKDEIDAGISRGNNYMDVTGGEPSIYPGIEELISYAMDRGIRSCIITNGIMKPEKADSLLASGLHGFLVSRHGLEGCHNFITNHVNGYKKQLIFLDRVAGRCHLRFNVVITRHNQSDLSAIADELIEYNPVIVNFINFNPHHEWVSHDLQAKDVIADWSIVSRSLDDAIDKLENAGVGVNVRYSPMCRVNEFHRKNICNDLHVVFDPYEWDYSIQPKTFDAFYDWGARCSASNELKSEPCSNCALFNQCGGINKHFRRNSLDAVRPVLGEKSETDCFFYRKHNIMCLQEPK